MLFVGENGEKRLTQTQMKCMLQLLGGNVAKIRNGVGSIVVVGKSKVGYIATVEALVELGAVYYVKALDGWCLTEIGAIGARKFAYHSSIKVLAAESNREFDISVDDATFKAIVVNQDVYIKHRDLKVLLFCMGENDRHQLALFSNIDIKTKLLLEAFKERLVQHLLAWYRTA